MPISLVTLYTFNDRWQVLMEADADEGSMLREFVYGNGIDEPLIMVNGALREGKMQNAECKIMGKLIAAWSVIDTNTAPTGPTIAPLAYYADAAADWQTEQPLFTTKRAKDHEGTAGDEQPIFTMEEVKEVKETGGMGQPESGKGLSADWGGFTQIDSQAAGFNHLRSSAESVDNKDLPVLPLVECDPNALVGRGDARVALMAESSGLEYEPLVGGEIVSLTLHAVREGEIVSLTLHAVREGEIGSLTLHVAGDVAEWQECDMYGRN